MTDERLVQLITEAVLKQLGKVPAQCSQDEIVFSDNSMKAVDGILPDLTTPANKAQVTVKNPDDKDAIAQMKTKTSARIGIGKAGARLKTNTYLTLRADHAGARDAVFRDVSHDFLKEMKLFSVDTMCSSRNEHLTRPDLGRQLSDDVKRELKSKCQLSPRVQIYVSDGLSSQAIEANIKDTLPALLDGLQGFGIGTGTPFFVRYGRVAAMDAISETLDAEVTCVLIGERPGLATANSMSAYIAYRATVGMPESRRTVVSNIHSGGIPPVEAGAHIAQVIKTMLEAKKSGVDLQL
ncbi:MAG: ethanolamine ammonia-lyase subunit EutC [Clostridiales bacterium]|nr:ethanolamine ammonia-lyase subunit EutC [Clostridiales bacterium]MDY3746829.1 ethanolamine ammonia-lyase subunit EutC [Lachnospiraceae bacterium]